MTISSLEAGRLLLGAGFHVHHQTATHVYYQRGHERIMIAATRQDIPKPVESRVLKFVRGEKDARTIGKEAMLGLPAPAPVADMLFAKHFEKPGEPTEEELTMMLEPQQEQEQSRGLIEQLEDFTLAAEIEHEELNRLAAELVRRAATYRKVQGVCAQFGIELPELPALVGVLPDTRGYALLADTPTPTKPKPITDNQTRDARLDGRLDALFEKHGNSVPRYVVGQAFGGKGATEAYSRLEERADVTETQLRTKGHAPTRVYVRRVGSAEHG